MNYMGAIFFCILIALIATAKQKTQFAITGMTCAGCASMVEKALKSVKGVSVLSVDAKTGLAVIEAEDFVDVNSEEFQKVLAEAGKFKATAVTKLK